jgi:hypothetical protein
MIGTLERLCSNSYTVMRLAAGSYDANGRYSVGSSSTFSVNASIQPVSGRDLLRLPEGLRTKQLLAIWTRTPLQTALAPNGPPPDVLTYTDGLGYQVQTVLDWTENGGYSKYIAQKVGQ